MNAAIRCEGVTKRFGAVTALDGLQMEVPSGQVVGYLGPNGAGKSTTIRLLLDLARPTAGRLEVLGSDPRTGGASIRRRVGYVPGELRLDDRLTVGETFESWARLRGGDLDTSYLDRLCQRFDLDPTRHTKDLSSGNRRKVGVVGAFMARPELLVLDEPTGGLDPLMQAEFQELVHEVRNEGSTVFLSSHVLSEVQHVADHVIVIRRGRVVSTGSVDELRLAARQPFIAWFEDDPPEAELRATPGVAGVEVLGQQVRGVVEGSPTPLLRVLGGYRLSHLLMPEPDLEEAFLRFYEDDGER